MSNLTSQLLPSPPLTSIHLFSMSVSLLLLCKSVCVCSVAQSCPTLCNPMDYSPPSSSVHGILQTRILQWIQFSSVIQSCVTLCHPKDCSAPGLIVHHQLLKNAQTHIHRVGDAIQPSYPLLSPFPPAFNFSQHQGLFQ